MDLLNQLKKSEATLHQKKRALLTDEQKYYFDTHVMIKEIPLRMNNTTVRIDAEIEGLISLAIVQNFVPVVDDNEIFIGIIRRREIIEYYAKRSPDALPS